MQTAATPRPRPYNYVPKERSSAELDTRRRLRLEAAERARVAFRHHVQVEHGLSWTELARLAELPTASVLSNFDLGTTMTLMADTIAKVALVLPQAPWVLMGGARDDAWMGRLRLEVRMIAGVNAKPSRQMGEVPRAERRVIGAPVGPALSRLSPYAVEVANPGAELIYPDGAMLVCAPISAATLPDLQPGRRVVVVRYDYTGDEARDHETTIRELESSGDCDRGLMMQLRTRTPLTEARRQEIQGTMLVPEWDGGLLRHAGYKLRVAALVESAFIPEGSR